MKRTLAAAIGLFAAFSAAEAAVGHHGGLILHCDPPQFFDETPAAESHVGSFQSFSVTASDNTDADTIKVAVNNQPVPVKITTERSGNLHVEGSLPAPITAGRVWLRVTGDSHDGCDDLKTWNVYVDR